MAKTSLTDRAQLESPQPAQRSQRLRQLNTKGILRVNSHLLSPQSGQSGRAVKRYATDTPPEEPQQKKHRRDQASKTSGSDIESVADYGSVVLWEEYFGEWPPRFVESHIMAASQNNKRSHMPARSSSYSQSVRDGESPTAWTRQHQEKMQEAGLIMTAYLDRPLPTDECKQLCQELLSAKYTLPEEPALRLERFAKVLDRVRYRNEARITRDVLPIIVPSAELLHIDGHARLEGISEAMDAEWTQCGTLCGPRPKPDFVVGIAASTLSSEEKEKLQLSHTSASPNLFPENMYFPFLICEVKGSDRSIDEAERQAMHSASIAVHAIIQLYRQASAVDEVDRKLLVFSVAHNHSSVKIYGHYAKTDGERITYYRHRLYLNDFAEDLSREALSGPYQITRAIYDRFFPKHLDRIRQALARVIRPTLSSATSQLDLDENSRESAVGQFKKPSLPLTLRLEQENERLRDQLLGFLRDQQAESTKQREQSERQLTQQKAHMEGEMEKQLAQQKEQTEKQLAQQKEQMEKQLAQQKEQMENQLAQHREIISLIKETRIQ